mmetsp:Transcript_31871/g.95403  ORF Transcript_31871/g.95403 Transcript_31871/m.95403 type:complete len:90 (+) Transcript_31871:825-1094(+)
MEPATSPAEKTLMPRETRARGDGASPSAMERVVDVFENAAREDERWAGVNAACVLLCDLMTEGRGNEEKTRAVHDSGRKQNRAKRMPIM